MKTTILLAALALLASGAQAHEEHNKAKPGAEAPATAPLAKPKRDPQVYFSDRVLYNQDGKPMKFYSDVLKGRTVVMSTMYTNCKDACPLITEQLNKVRAALGDSFGKDIFFVMITSDQKNDSPQALKKYAVKNKADGPGWIFLTGKSKDDTDFVLKRIGQWSENVEAHSTQLVAFNFKTDRGRKMMPNLPPDALAAQIQLLAAGDEVLPIPGLSGAPKSN